jgi:hypothetical protein
MKFCIFCGRPPRGKSKEHVIPRWLIEMTGDPNRIVHLGFRIGNSNGPEERKFAFDQFTFPACETCNNNYSGFENDARRILSLILSNKSVLGLELSKLLDWFDKVRVGLWLGFHQLDKNILDVQPNFHIDQRIGQFDRVLIIEKSHPMSTGLNLIGPESPSFGYTPSVLSLRVNNYHFTNISYMYLVSRRLGFPYPSSIEWTSDLKHVEAKLEKGRERIMKPVLKRHISEKGVILFQPMFAGGLAETPPLLYDTEYVRRNSMDYDNGIGSIYMQPYNNSHSLVVPSEKIHLNPTPLHRAYEQCIRSAISVAEWQNWLLDNMVGTNLLTPEHKQVIKNDRRSMMDFNNQTMQRLKAFLAKRISSAQDKNH